MTSLFRQGVESVCRGKRDRQRARPLAAGSSSGARPGDRHERPGSRAKQARSSVALKAGGQAAPVVYPTSLLPTEGDHTRPFWDAQMESGSYLLHTLISRNALSCSGVQATQ